MTQGYTPAELDDLKTELVSWLFSLDAPFELHEAGRFLESRIDPLVYRTVGKLNDRMLGQGARFTRLVAEWMGCDDLLRVFPQLERFVRSYEAGEGEIEPMSQAYREVVSLGACVDLDLLHLLYAAVLSVYTSEELARRSLHSGVVEGQDAFNTLYRSLQRCLSAGLVVERVPEWVSEVQPVHIPVRDRGVVRYFRLPACIRIFNPLADAYDVVVEEPVQVQRIQVDTHYKMPWSAAHKGIQIEVRFQGADRLMTRPEQFFLTPQQLERLQHRGSAIPVRIGRHGEIRMHREYTTGVLLDEGPDAPTDFVSLRSTPRYLEVYKLLPQVQLTVFA